MFTILVVDDDQPLLRMLERTLSYQGYQIITASDGQKALHQASDHRPDIIVLDWMMPTMDGLEVLSHLRTVHDETPVLMLTARDAIENRVQGLEAGADDYLVKPFAPEELIARIHALLRRSGAAASTKPLSVSGLTLDPATRQAHYGNQTFDLTPTEFDLLYLLMRHPNQVLERGQILNDIWGYDFSGEDNVLDVYVGYLRKKINAAGCPRLIHTVRGAGYVLRQDQ